MAKSHLKDEAENILPLGLMQVLPLGLMQEEQAAQQPPKPCLAQPRLSRPAESTPGAVRAWPEREGGWAPAASYRLPSDVSTRAEDSPGPGARKHPE